MQEAGGMTGKVNRKDGQSVKLQKWKETMCSVYIIGQSYDNEVSFVLGKI